jgi:hypothetical protein
LNGSGNNTKSKKEDKTINNNNQGFSFPVKDEQFKKSSRSQPGGIINCVAIAKVEEGVAVRDTKDGTKTTLYFKHSEWKAFLEGAKSGEFD